MSALLGVWLWAMVQSDWGQVIFATSVPLGLGIIGLLLRVAQRIGNLEARIDALEEAVRHRR